MFHSPQNMVIPSLLDLFYLLLLFHFSCVSTRSSLSKGTSISVEKPEDVLVSPKAIFTAGFYTVGDNAYCFAIWCSKPLSNGDHTIVWMANRDQPVNGRLSKLVLHKNGNLFLTDAGRSTVWATNTNSSSMAQLRLHDTGNLVLLTSDGVVLWQSFDSPSDTILPLQPFTRYTRLVSSRSLTDHSSGFYKLFFDDDNILRLVFNSPETSSIYWPDPWLTSDNSGRSRYNDTRFAVFDESGRFLSSDLLEFLAADYGPGPLRRLTLDHDGNLRMYSLDATIGRWIVSWQSKTKACRIHGACGINGMCSYSPVSGRRCTCLPGFRMKNPADWSSGCVEEFNLSCNNDNAFIKQSNADFYGYDIHIFRNYTLEQCTKTCLDLCSCKGFHHRFNDSSGAYDCNPKWLLRNGHRSPSLPGDLYVKVSRNQLSTKDESIENTNLNCSSEVIVKLDRIYKEKQENEILTVLLWFACGLGGVEIISIFSVWCLLIRTQGGSGKAMDGYLLAVNGFKRFSYAELKKATRDFSEEIGRGGGGIVYKGVLHDGRVAAIKRLTDANQGEAEFLAEVNTIGKINHMHLIEIWGYCAEEKHRLLIYEYIVHGSLAENLYSNTLDGEKRFEIAVGTAKGLAYLHDECLEWVLHCDIKPQNILLDSNFDPKVSDFGLSKLLSRANGGDLSFSRIRGTRGYMAPEWIYNLPITSKVDVYSYGMVLLEMVTGKSATSELQNSDGGIMQQSRWINCIKGKVKSGTTMGSWIEDIVDPMLRDGSNIVKMQILVEVALQCVEEDRDARPTMNHVVQMLQSYENDDKQR